VQSSFTAIKELISNNLHRNPKV